MESCERHELSIEKALHGGLSEAVAEQLSAHLSRCASCRAYREATLQMENVMRDQTQSMPPLRSGRALPPSRRGRGVGWNRAVSWLALGMLVLLSGLPALWPLLLAWGGAFVWIRYYGPGRDPLAAPGPAGPEADWISASRSRLDSLVRFFEITVWLLVAYAVFAALTHLGGALVLGALPGLRERMLPPGVAPGPLPLLQDIRGFVLLAALVQLGASVGLIVFVRGVVLADYRLRRRALAD